VRNPRQRGHQLLRPTTTSGVGLVVVVVVVVVVFYKITSLHAIPSTSAKHVSVLPFAEQYH
jgi:hypothetical protein